MKGPGQKVANRRSVHGGEKLLTEKNEREFLNLFRASDYVWCGHYLWINDSSPLRTLVSRKDKTVPKVSGNGGRPVDHLCMESTLMHRRVIQWVSHGLVYVPIR